MKNTLKTFFTIVCCSFIGYSQSTVLSDKILVYTKTNGYRHKSIETGVNLIKKLGAENNFSVAHTEDSLQFTTTNLSQYKMVLFLSTTEDVLGEEQQKAFQNYIRSGGNFMGIHAATDTEFGWSWYGNLVGAYFVNHPNSPNVREATMNVIDHTHKATRMLPDSTWIRKDEWYNFKEISPHIKVLVNLDETSYEGGTHGKNHPIAWHHEFEGARVFYTGGGHTVESYAEPLFVAHLLGGIEYCLGRD